MVDWKEELVLQFRKLTIDKNIISRAMQNLVNEVNSNLDKYKIDGIEATTDLSEYIDIKGYKRIEIKYYESKIVFTLFNKEEDEQDVFVELSVVKGAGLYLIYYGNTENLNPEFQQFIDENTIDKIFQNLFELNEELKTISR
ncbi:hypothetical protein [Clostridium sp. FP1]|uniref:hypothetical protein n=1 Tax=Clostridium sp. FP1 TaxID=2724076 RepID=UPI0013E94B97|nr:hypothetical protein [Clostridium sp. FP1]MBZ9635514.1 hypothetical protein [Clostridium sp. FP1]